MDKLETIKNKVELGKSTSTEKYKIALEFKKSEIKTLGSKALFTRARSLIPEIKIETKRWDEAWKILLNSIDFKSSNSITEYKLNITNNFMKMSQKSQDISKSIQTLEDKLANKKILMQHGWLCILLDDIVNSIEDFNLLIMKDFTDSAIFIIEKTATKKSIIKWPEKWSAKSFIWIFDTGFWSMVIAISLIAFLILEYA